MYAFHPLTLTFDDPGTERAFHHATMPRMRQQGVVAMMVGTVVYLLCGVLDLWFLPPELSPLVWNIRFVAILVPITILLIAKTAFYERFSNLLLASTGLAAGTGLIAIQVHLPMESTAYYYPLMVLVTFYTYNFIGTRFIYAFGVDLLLLIAYNVVFGFYLEYPRDILAAHDLIIVFANLIGGAAGYLSERQRRMLFIREDELDTERRKHLHRALHDPLTDLPNRDLLHDRLEQAILTARRTGRLDCGYFLDFNGFKEINDTLGHRAGDLVLQFVGRRLSGCVRESDTVARMGGDEFFVLAIGIEDLREAGNVADKLLQCLDAPIPGLPENHRIRASIGLCIYPDASMSASEVIHCADMAMYREKNALKEKGKSADA